MIDLAFARLTHCVHVDADDSCPLCIAAEVRATATARIEQLRAVDPFTEPDGGRLIGKFMVNAYRRLDLAEYIEDGTAIVTHVERSAAFGLSIEVKEVAR